MNPLPHGTGASISNAALQLAQPNEPDFDHRRWEWSLRDSGLLAVFKPADSKLIILAKSVANKLGEFDLSVSWAADVLAMTRRGIQGALKRLAGYGVIEHAGKSATHRQVERYRLIYPPATGPTVAAETGADSSRKTCERGFHLRTGVPQPENHGSQTCERGFSQSERKAKEKAAQGPPPPIAPLFQAKPYDAEATAKLVGMGFDKRRAHGLVTQYRPTAAEIANVAANIDAKNAEAGDNPRRRVRNVQAFAIHAMKSADYALDERVATRRRKAEQLAQRREVQGDQARERAAAADRYWRNLTDAERDRAERVAREMLPPSQQDDPAAVRTAAIYRARAMGLGDWKTTE